MNPLDLTARPPRPCRETLDGIVFLARNIDKARAALPGGTTGAYFLARDDVPTLSGLFFRRFGCSQAEFVDAVAAASDDAAVVAWLRERADQAKIDAWNGRMQAIRMRDLDDSVQAFMKSIYVGPRWNGDDLLIDVIDADDRRNFS